MKENKYLYYMQIKNGKKVEVISSPINASWVRLGNLWGHWLIISALRMI